MTDVYLSYELRDRELAIGLANTLKAYDLSVGTSEREILTADELGKVLAEARFVIVLATPRGLKSPHVMHEAITALEQGNLILVTTDDLDRDKIPSRLQKVETLRLEDADAFAKTLAARIREPAADAPVSSKPRERTFHIGGVGSGEAAPAPPDEVWESRLGSVARESAEDDVARRDALYRERMATDDVPITAGSAPRAARGILNDRLSLDRLASWSAARSAALKPDIVTVGGPLRPPIPTRAPEPVGAPPTRMGSYHRPEEADMPARGGGYSLIDYALPVAFAVVATYVLVSTSLGRDILGKLTALLGFKYEAFSFLGLLGQRKPPPPPPSDAVDCSVFAPPAAPPGAAVLVQVFLHVPEHAERAQSMASMMDQSAVLKGVQTLQIAVPRGSAVTVSLSAPGLEIDEPQQTVIWRGEPAFCQFLVTLPEQCEGKSFHPVVRLAVAGGLVGRIAFRLAADRTADAPQSAPQGESARRYTHAFLSYAAADRREVLKRAQILEAAGVSFFQDILKLDPGARWQKEIYRNIDTCDLFLLFWSRAAMSSEWVIKEAEYALRRQMKSGSIPDIVPVILETPPPLPPEGLADIHFNDRIHYLISAN